MVTEELTVESRKIPLYYIRKKMFCDHQIYMRLHTDEEIKSFDKITLIDLLKKERLFRLFH